MLLTSSEMFFFWFPHKQAHATITQWAATPKNALKISDEASTQPSIILCAFSGVSVFSTSAANSCTRASQPLGTLSYQIFHIYSKTKGFSM